MTGGNRDALGRFTPGSRTDCWTPEQDAILRTRYPHERTETIARDLGRGLRATYARAAALGLKKAESNRWGAPKAPDRCPTCGQPIPARRHPVTVAGVEARPMTRDHLDGSPEERFWRALDRLGRPHDADTPEAAATAAGARIATKSAPFPSNFEPVSCTPESASAFIAAREGSSGETA